MVYRLTLRTFSVLLLCLTASCRDSSGDGPCTKRSETDMTCDGVDDDCNGTVDDGFIASPTTCGAGACLTNGLKQCTQGVVVDTCAPRLSASPDTTCNGVDDDCDGQVDEEYVSTATTCGLGACSATGATTCKNGVVSDTCSAKPPASTTDTTCDGVDENCNGQLDEGYLAAPTACGVGPCARTGVTSCVNAQVHDSCMAAPATSTTDSSCDGVDDDCDGSTDEEYLAPATSCGVGACARSGVAQCTAGSITDTCTSAAPSLTDTTCDGQDDDCDGQVDEQYVSVPTSCGAGACAATGVTSCNSGHVVDSCAPSPAATSDATCDGVDDDCNGQVDEDYATVSTTCGVGACARAGQRSCANAQVTDSCAAGVPASGDATCNGIDDDCNGQVDEDYVTTFGACASGCVGTGSLSCADGGVQQSCDCTGSGSQANPGSSCRAILEARLASDAGVPPNGSYFVQQPPALPTLTYCEMTTDFGGWTTIYVGKNGSPNAFDHFDNGGYAGTFNDPLVKQLQRPVATVAEGFPEMAVSCGGAMVSFPATEKVAGYFLRGEQRGWVSITPKVVSGVVPTVPNTLFTGIAADYGFVFTRNQLAGGNTFASSHTNPAFDFCDGAPSTSAVTRIFYREPPKPSARNTPSTALTSCRAILKAGDSTGDGYYYLRPTGTSSAVLAYCDMTHDGGGWTTLYAGLNGSDNIFGHFDDAPFSGVCTDPGRRCVRRAPVSLADSAAELGALCGDAMVTFPMTEATRLHLTYGTQQGWVPITPKVVSGFVATPPNTFYTGAGVSHGVVLTRNQLAGGNTFLSTHENAAFDACNGVPDNATPARLMYREADPTPIRNTVSTSGLDCFELRQAGATADGLYWIRDGASVPYVAYCDMTSAGGGWTSFFAGRNGSPNVFDHFSAGLYTGGCPDPASRCLRHVPSSVSEAATEVLASCGSKSVRFATTVPLADFFGLGVEYNWVGIEAKLVNGPISTMPNTLFTGLAGGGFILSRNQLSAGNTFASSHTNGAYDSCANVPDQVSMVRLAYRRLPAATIRNTAAAARASCKAILDASESQGDGLYYVTNGSATAALAYCDMTTSGGGWTALFSGRNGSPHVFDVFDTGSQSLCPDPTTKCLRRAPSFLTPGTSKLAVSCGGAMVEFPLTAQAAGFFVNGVQSGWAGLTPTVISGSVVNVPNTLWTGLGADHGFVFTRNQLSGANSFGASYAGSTIYDLCNNAGDTTSLLRVYYRE